MLTTATSKLQAISYPEKHNSNATTQKQAISYSERHSLEDVWMLESVHELDLAQHLLAVLAMLVHLQHHHLPCAPVLNLPQNIIHTPALNVNATVCTTTLQA